MANPPNVVAPWQRGNVRIWSRNAISTAPSGNPEACFKNVGLLFPIPDQSLDEYDHQADGRPIKKADGYSLGIERNQFSIQLPFQLNAMTLLFGSVLQSYSFLTGNVTHLPYTTNPAALFFAMEVGWGTETISQVVGAIVKTLRVSFPPVGADGGRPTIEADCLAYQIIADKDAFTGTAPAVDVSAPTFTYNLAITDLAANQDKFVSANVQIENNADWSPNAGSLTDAFFLGPLKITGDIVIAMAAAAADEWITAYGRYKGKTQLDSIWTPTAGSTWKIPLLTRKPEGPEVAGNVATIRLPFEGVDKDADEPGFVHGAGLSDIWVAW